MFYFAFWDVTIGRRPIILTSRRLKPRRTDIRLPGLASDLLSGPSSFSVYFLTRQNYNDHDEDTDPRQVRVSKNKLIKHNNDIGPRNARGKERINDKRDNDIGHVVRGNGWSSVVRGFGPVHQRQFLVTNPCVLETPTVVEDIAEQQQ